MKKNNPKIIITLFSVIVGIFIATQMKMKVESYAPVTLRSIQNTKAEINQVKNEIAEINRIIKMKEEELEIWESISKGGQNIMDILSLDLELNKKQSGYTKLEGPGIVITMYDNLEDNPFILDVNDEIIHDVDVLNLLNDLRIAGAEAISINNERVLSTSEIKCGGPIIRVNNRSYGTPFVIRAIGDPKVLMASINAPGTYGDMLKNIYMIGIETEEKDKLTIPAYRGVFNFRYAKPVGEGD